MLKTNSGSCWNSLAGLFNLTGNQCNPNDAAVVWQVAQSTINVSSITWHVLGVGWASGNTYTAYFRGRDRANNYQQGWSTRTFSYDAERPLSNISVPLDDAQIKDAAELQNITWTHSDPGFSGINQVRFKMRRNTDGACWRIGGSGWNTTGAVVAACADGGDDSGYFATWTGGAQSQSTFLINADLSEGTSYQIMIRARDNASNFENAIETVTFHFDGLKPVAKPTYPA